MLLCNYNQTVISASSDRTLKAWSPHLQDKSMIPVTLGTHTDYVRTLAHGRDTSWVASAGLDKHIKLWNIAESRKTPIGASSALAAGSAPEKAWQPHFPTKGLGRPYTLLRPTRPAAC